MTDIQWGRRIGGRKAISFNLFLGPSVLNWGIFGPAVTGFDDDSSANPLNLPNSTLYCHGSLQSWYCRHNGFELGFVPNPAWPQRSNFQTVCLNILNSHKFRVKVHNVLKSEAVVQSSNVTLSFTKRWFWPSSTTSHPVFHISFSESPPHSLRLSDGEPFLCFFVPGRVGAWLVWWP